jgi:predicted nucleotidyltransferase
MHMDLERPLQVVTPTVDGDVLRVLALADARFTAPRIHELTGDHSENGIRKVLARLVEQGIVDSETYGRTTTYAFNRDHLAAEHILGLSRMRADLLERLRAALASWMPPCAYAAIFGSAARGDMTTASDLDLFLVRNDKTDADDPRWSGQVEQLRREVSRWTGNELRTVELTASEVTAGLRKKLPLLASVRVDGLSLVGPTSYLAPQVRKR